MDLQEFKNFVENNLLTCDGNFNTNTVRKKWMIKHHENVYSFLLSQTLFLSDECSLRERIYCVLNEIKSKIKCKCGNDCGFAGSGYKATCGKKECIKNRFKETLNKVGENGLTHLQNRITKFKETQKIVDDNGLTKAQNRYRKADKTKKELGIYKLAAIKFKKTTNTIEENGLTKAQNNAIKAVKTKKAAGTFERSIIKFKETMKIIGDDGLNGFQRKGIKQKITKRNSIDENGFDGYQRSGQKSANTKRNNIDENGLNGFQRSFLNGASRSPLKIYNAYLHYQGSYEKYFLDSLRNFSWIHLVKNGLKIPYIKSDGGKSFYHSDYYMHKVFEIKSHYTYDNFGKDLDSRINNNLKWKTTLEQGHGLVIFWDRSFLMELYLNDIKNIEDNLYLEHKFIEFNERNLGNMMIRWFNECGGKLNIDLSRMKMLSQKLNR